MAGNESLTDVTLRPWPVAKKEELSPQDLLLQIEQLGTERGHLRDVTEKTLQEDILAGKDIPEDAAAAALEQKKKDKKEAPSKEERLQEVIRMQQEMSSHMEWAKFAASNTVDLISLILSADPNKRSLTHFSHTFKTEGLNQGLPFGSFGVSKENHVQHVYKTEEVQNNQEYAQRQELVSKGSRMAALDVATDDILKAARKLEKEVRRETKYWQEIVSISDKGWPIQRLRQNQNMRNVPFAVRYGHPEASNHFKARSLAPLRMDKDGSIILDPALALKPKTLRVRISENGKITGTSRLPTDETSSVAIEATIQRARNSLFEEELYHEMSLETRHLLAYGVEYRESVITVNASATSGQQSTMKLLIDCIPLDDRSATSQDHTNDGLARNVAEGLHMLLTHEHSMRLHRRSQLPPPLTGQKREKPSPPLLRTLLSMFRHLEGVDSLYSYLATTAKTLESAGLHLQIETTRETSWARLAESLQTAPRKGLSATDQLLDVFSKPFEGKATLLLPTSNSAQPEILTISTRTVIGQPTFGTEHKLTLPSTLAASLELFQQQKLSTTEELTSYLDWIISLHIAHRQLMSDFPTRAVIKSNDARITVRSKDAKKAMTVDKDISVEFQHGILRVTATVVDSEEVTEGTEQSCLWTGQEDEMTLTERVKSWVG